MNTIFALLGLAVLYVIVGLAIMPKLNPALPKFDYAAFFKSIAYAFTWPVAAWNHHQAKKANKG